MFRNYVKVAFRNIVRHKGYSFINIVGLAIGMACCIMIMLWVQNELTYDGFHANSDRLYRVCTELNIGEKIRTSGTASAPMGPAFKEAIPEVEYAARFIPRERSMVKYGDRQYSEENVIYADDDFLKALTFSLIKGNPETALAEPHSIILTEETAKKYFGNDEPVGNTLTFSGEEKFTVTGVAENVPRNSSINFDMLCSYETLYSEDRSLMEMWGRFGTSTFLLIDRGVDVDEVEEKIASIIDANLGDVLQRAGASVSLFLQPITDIHLHSNLESDPLSGGDIYYVYVFSGIALFILLIACFNFINLSTARQSTRAREAGIRKTLGAFRGKLAVQYLGESVIYSLLAFIFSLIIIEFALPLFNSIASTSLDLNYGQQTWLLPAMIGCTILVGLLAGSYPSFLLSSMQPINILKGNLATGRSGQYLRRVFVAVQFAISVTLIIGTIIIYNQINYMKNKNLGFDKEQVIVLPNANGPSPETLSLVRDEMAELAGVQDVSLSSGVPGEGRFILSNFIAEGYSEDENQLMRVMLIDDHFLSTMKMRIVAGRNFSKEFASDASQSAIINETAARLFGWDNPIGKTIRHRARNIEGLPWTTKTVIGVIEDFHLSSLHQEIEPLFMGHVSDDSFGSLVADKMIAARLMPGDISASIGSLEKIWDDVAPDYPFDLLFLDETLNSQYRAEERLNKIFNGFSILAIMIACLGLIGLVSFAAEKRKKEIGVRKVLGASVVDVVKLLTREFLILVMIANIVAWPVAYFAMDRWLQDFPYRIEIGWVAFVLAGILALVIALVTVAYQSVRAAQINPVETLRYE